MIKNNEQLQLHLIPEYDAEETPRLIEPRVLLESTRGNRHSRLKTIDEQDQVDEIMNKPTGVSGNEDLSSL